MDRSWFRHSEQHGVPLMWEVLSVELPLTVGELLLLLSVGVFAAMVLEGVFSLAFYTRHHARRERAFDERNRELAEVKAELGLLKSKGVDHGD